MSHGVWVPPSHFISAQPKGRAFAFQGRNGQINLLKEKRRRGSEGYWYAYQRQASGMVKRYLGRSNQVRVERLEEIATQLAEQTQPVPTSLAGLQLVCEEFVVHPTGAAHFKFLPAELDFT